MHRPFIRKTVHIIKHLKLASKEKTAITCVSQEKMHVETEGVAAPPHPALMALLQGLGDEIRLLPERLEQYKSCNEGHFEALTTDVTTGFNKIEKLISSTSMAQDQPTVGTDAKNFVSTQPSLTPAPAAPAYGDASASVLIVDQGVIAPDPVIDIVLHAMKVRQREQEALIPNSYHRWEFLGTILGSWIMHTDGSDDDRGHKLHTSLGHENLG
ncbi:hypothetical protein Taro_041089 [Colocasia esculenta]|uniref:Uncharacterized protein n=1 Tax=Colocasia esculenta TaxID=4460 RepID=A0A843WWB6_COLES|nr:hypothetical protein [Colocasia esculenta]